MKIYAISDLHGNLNILLEELQRKGFNDKEDHLVICGDLFDRGNENREVAEWFIKNYKKSNYHFILGNHDVFLRDFFRNNLNYRNNYMDIKFNMDYNGFDKTLRQLSGIYDIDGKNIIEVKNNIESSFPELREALESMEYYYESEHHIFAHGSVLNGYKDVSSHVWENECIWANTPRWLESENFPKHKNIVVGHWSIQNFRQAEDTIYQYKNVYCIDGGLGHGTGLPLVYECKEIVPEKRKIVKGDVFERVEWKNSKLDSLKEERFLVVSSIGGSSIKGHYLRNGKLYFKTYYRDDILDEEYFRFVKHLDVYEVMVEELQTLIKEDNNE